jgi:hypothetical protein
MIFSLAASSFLVNSPSSIPETIAPQAIANNHQYQLYTRTITTIPPWGADVAAPNIIDIVVEIIEPIINIGILNQGLLAAKGIAPSVM